MNRITTGVKKIRLTCLVLLLANCAGEAKIEVMAGVDSCQECGMIIDQVNQACGYLADNKFVVFDSPGCLLRSYESIKKEGGDLPAQIYFADYTDGSFHLAESTAFLLTVHMPTVMNAQVLTFRSNEAAESTSLHSDEVITDWIGYQTVRGDPNRVVKVAFGPDGMVPESVEVEKDDLVLFRISGHDLTEDLTISIRGYPEMGSVLIPAGVENIEFRLLATRPGAGFPIGPSSGDPLGMMKVIGAHTQEEEVR